MIFISCLPRRNNNIVWLSISLGMFFDDLGKKKGKIRWSLFQKLKISKNATQWKVLSFSTYHIEIFFQNSFSKFSKKLKKKIFFGKFWKKKKFWKFWKTVLKKKIYMISWKNKHFSLLTFFEILDFWNNDYLILPIFWPKPSSDKLPLIPSWSKWISWAYFQKKIKNPMRDARLGF